MNEQPQNEVTRSDDLEKQKVHIKAELEKLLEKIPEGRGRIFFKFGDKEYAVTLHTAGGNREDMSGPRALYLTDVVEDVTFSKIPLGENTNDVFAEVESALKSVTQPKSREGDNKRPTGMRPNWNYLLVPGDAESAYYRAEDDAGEALKESSKALEEINAALKKYNEALEKQDIAKKRMTRIEAKYEDKGADDKGI